MEHFASLLSFDLVEFITWIGAIGVPLVVFAESGLLIGFFLPGDSLLFTAGLMVHQGLLNVNIHWFVLVLVIAAITGDSVGYTFGHRVGRRLFKKPNSLLFNRNNLLKAEEFYKTHGAKTIVLARFIPFVRTFAPIIAGVSKMPYRTFLTFNVVGSLLWAAGITYLGYYLGAWLESRGIDIDKYILLIIALIIATSLIPPVYHLLKNKQNRDASKLTIKNILHKIFKR